MHSPETQQKFIERRAQAWTLVRIGAELGVAKSTLIDWSRKFRFDTSNQRAILMDELRDRVLGSVQSRVAVLAEKLALVEGELKQRDLAQLSTARLYALADSFRRQIKQETDAIHFAAPVNAIPADEYVEQVQEWKP